jgi:hypothetical protein
MKLRKRFLFIFFTFLIELIHKSEQFALNIIFIVDIL